MAILAENGTALCDITQGLFSWGCILEQQAKVNKQNFN